MDFLDGLTIADFFMIMAVLLGPVLAIQATRFLDDRKEKMDRKMKLFKTLMSTRSYRTTWDHVSTLNNIDLEFNKNKEKEYEVILAWKAYLDSLHVKGISDKQEEYFIDLLYKMATVLEYDFDKTHIKNSSYMPVAHGNIDSQQELIRKGLIDVLYQDKSISMFVTNIENQNNQDSQIKDTFGIS